MFCEVTHNPKVTILSKCEACSGLLPFVVLGVRSDERGFYFPLMSHLHNPTSTAVGYLERQAGFRWGSFGETQHLQLVLELQPEAAVTSALSGISFLSPSAAEVHSGVKHRV